MDKLEQKGLLVRQPSDRDRRVILAELTQAGNDLMAGIFPDHAQAIQLAMNGLSRDEQLQATALLKKLGLAAQANLAQPS